ncbi:multidrug resistance-like ATP-binding protein MdlB [Clostridium tepidiprofundi DSM 19306]|uniref:Multidrug resistance-like ATP-binding protein MdlB n=1 Tax=Clostridium tepidiprofundi DSM 19306 TaxID=1121338 RepID=A0A151B2N9_9CLOT|nr:ABC transporter ATP-binding protein [Clostridium tepidiprofundi]KYH34156.1 multidrug resistance-like ATP-binding protein MdlB [Clostridium tepidiprofundi DSM 19306]
MKKYIYEIRFFIVIQLLLDALSTGIIAFIPYIQKLLIDMISQEGHVRYSFTLLTILFFACIIGYSLCSYISSIYTYRGIIGFEVALKRGFFRNVFNYNYEEFSSRDIGEYISIQGNDITQIQQSYLQPSIDLIRSIINLIIYSVILFVYVDWRIATAILFMSLVTIFIPKITGKELSNKQNDYLKQKGVYVSRIKDFLEGFTLIQRRTRTNINNEHEKVLKATADKRFTFGAFKVLSLTIYEMSMYFVKFLAFIIAGKLLLKGEITVGTAVATFGYVGCFLDPLQDILNDINAINSIKGTKERVMGYIRNNTPHDLEVMKEFEENIVFDNVSFHYKNFSLQNVSYTFKKGKKYAVIGHSGSGKSTIIKLLMKYMKPKTGDILVDGKSLNSIDTADIMCCINQNEHIFAENFYNNVTIFSSYSSSKLDGITNMFQTKIMDVIKEKQNCQLLSGGEKQVLSIMRMLTADTPICVMDEPFSATDVNITQILQNALLAMEDKTIIIVTHKLSEQLNQFDEILLMEDGKIIKSGSYEEILKTEEFKKLQAVA